MTTITSEEFRYDALGRRVLVYARKQCPRADADDPYCATYGNGWVTRTIWDGSQELGEIRRWDRSAEAEADTLPRGDGITWWPFDGDVLYTPGLAVDQPLSVIRIGYHQWRDNRLRLNPFAIIPQWSEQGGAPTAAFYFVPGELNQRCPDLHDPNKCIYILFPEGVSPLTRWQWAFLETDVVPPTDSPLRWRFWYGSLLEDKKDESGTLYRRNRYYDPSSGRFTQEDPLGLAGGLNLYGYAAGDPVNFSDPFGLKTCPPDCDGWTYLKDVVLGLRSLPMTGQDRRPLAVIGVSGTLLNGSASATRGAVSGKSVSVSVNTPSAGASLDVGVPYRHATPGEATGSVSYGVGKHMGVTVTNETVMLNIGISTPTASPVTVSVDVSSPRNNVPTTAVRQEAASDASSWVLRRRDDDEH